MGILRAVAATLVVAAVSGVPAAALERPPASVALDHWAYPLLERLAARRFVTLDLSTRPVSRRDVADALDGIDRADLSSRGTEREIWAVGRLRAEFEDAAVEPPAAALEDDGAMVGIGVTLGVEGVFGGRGETVEMWPGTVPAGLRTSALEADGVRGDTDDQNELDPAVITAYELWGGFDRRLGFEAETRIIFREQDGPRQVQLSSRARTWRGVAAVPERAYLLWEGERLSIAAGRRGPAWGRSRRGRLLISGAAPTFDQLDAVFRVGPLSFHALHAFVERSEDEPVGEAPPGEDVYIGAHRIVFSGSAGSIGASELVVYTESVPDPVYVNPLVPYYLMQHNERGDDNILWSLDYDWRAAPGVELYGAFVVDDLQYDRGTGYPDKYGATVGGAYFGSVGRMDAELTVEYTNVRKWTYTHHVVEHRLEHDGRAVGFELGPDADRVLLDARLHPTPSWTVALVAWHARRGEGRLTDPYEEGENAEPAFPSGVVETDDRVALEAGCDALDGISFGGGAAYRMIKNVDNIDGEDDNDWEFWAGVRFRIGRGDR